MKTNHEIAMQIVNRLNQHVTYIDRKGPACSIIVQLLNERDEDRQPDSSISSFVRACHANSVEKGWWEGAGEPGTIGTHHLLALQMLVVSELSEAVELAREPDFDPLATWAVSPTGEKLNYAKLLLHLQAGEELPKPEGFGTELADAVIRIFDVCGRLGIDLQARIAEKHAYNKTRPVRHGGKRA